MAIRSIAALAALAAGIGSAQSADLPSPKPAPPPLLTQLPAVDGLNAKLELFGGGTERFGQDSSIPLLARNRWKAAGGALGSVSLPLAHSFGLQFDGMIASAWGAMTGGAGAHAFWRDPSRALIGVYGGLTYVGRNGGLAIGRIGPEAEVYLGSVTLQGIAGVEFGSRKGQTFGAPWVTTAGAWATLGNRSVETRFYDNVSLAFYPIENLKLSIGQRYMFGRLAATAGIEYLVTHGRPRSPSSQKVVSAEVRVRRSAV